MEIDLQVPTPDWLTDENCNVEHPCCVCKNLCNQKTKTGHHVTVENCSQYGIPQSDIQPDTLVCESCYCKHLNGNHCRKPTEECENISEVPEYKENTQFDGKCTEPVCHESEFSEPVYHESEFSEPVCSEVYSNDKEMDVCNEKASEPVRSVDGDTQNKCSSVICPLAGRRSFSKLPSRLSSLRLDLQEAIKSEFGIIGEKVCDFCYKRIYNRCKQAAKVPAKIKIPFGSYKSRPPKTTGKQCSMKRLKMYACGWCKFRSEHSATVVKHHYRQHQRQELDVVRLKSLSPKCKSPSGIGFNCDSCEYTGRLRHQLHLHNDRFHQNSQNRDGITDCESDNAFSPVYPYFYYNMTLPSNYFQMQAKYKLKDVKIPCKDIFKCGLEYFRRNVYDQGISKLCVDSLTEDEFVSMATLYREDVSYYDTKVENHDPVNLSKFSKQEIKSIIKK